MLPNLLSYIQHLEVNKTVSPADAMFSPGSQDHYFYVGMTNILALINCLSLGLAYPGGNRDVKRILDFGCGHGRVTRYLRAAFPDAEIMVCDLDQEAAKWCSTTFDCRVITEVLAKPLFDIVWLGSVFTHLPENAAEALLSRLAASVRDNGVLALTSQGRFAVERLKGIIQGTVDDRPYARYGIEVSRLEKIIRGYELRGYGYVDYPHQSGYGVCCASPQWYSSRVLVDREFTQIMLQEKGSDNHQDIQSFMKTGIMSEVKGPLW